MFKRFLVVILCCTLTLLFSANSFSQEEKPTTTDEKAVEDKADESKDEPKEEEEKTEEAEKEKEASPEDQPSKIEGGALEAKTFFDGLNTFVNSKVLFKLSSKDNLMADKIHYKLDAGEIKTYESPFSISTEGKHSISYYSVDKIGNKENENTFRVMVDNTPPEVIVTSSKPVLKIDSKLYISKDFTFTVNSQDASSGVNKVEYSINGKDYTEYVAPFSIPSEGEVDIKIKALDNVTNITDKFAVKLFDETGKQTVLKDVSVKLSTDNIAPTVEIKTDKEIAKKDNKNIASSDVNYSVAANDKESGIASILVRVDGKGDFIPYMSEIKFTSNGEHTIEAKAIDKVGNVSSVAILSVYVDVIPPETKLETISK